MIDAGTIPVDTTDGPAPEQLRRARTLRRVGAVLGALAGAALVAAVGQLFWPEPENSDGLSSLSHALGAGMLAILGVLLALVLGVPGLTLWISGAVGARRRVRFASLVPMVLGAVLLGVAAVLVAAVALLESEPSVSTAEDEALDCTGRGEVLATDHRIPANAHTLPGAPTWGMGAVDLLQMQAMSFALDDPRRVLATARFEAARFADGYLGRDRSDRVVATVHVRPQQAESGGPETWHVSTDRVCSLPG